MSAAQAPPKAAHTRLAVSPRKRKHGRRTVRRAPLGACGGEPAADCVAVAASYARCAAARVSKRPSRRCRARTREAGDQDEHVCVCAAGFVPTCAGGGTRTHQLGVTVRTRLPRVAVLAHARLQQATPRAPLRRVVLLSLATTVRRRDGAAALRVRVSRVAHTRTHPDAHLRVFVVRVVAARAARRDGRGGGRRRGGRGVGASRAPRGGAHLRRRAQQQHVKRAGARRQRLQNERGTRSLGKWTRGGERERASAHTPSPFPP